MSDKQILEASEMPVSKRARFLDRGQRAAREIARWPAWMRRSITPCQADIRQLVPKPEGVVRPVSHDATPYSDPTDA